MFTWKKKTTEQERTEGIKGIGRSALRKGCHAGSTKWTGFRLTANTAKDISDADAGCVNPANGSTNRHGRIAEKQSGAEKPLRIIGWGGFSGAIICGGNGPMSEMYTRADLRHIAEYMIDDLRECEDGTVTTTAELAANQGYDDLEMDDLEVLHNELLRTAKANKITLDMFEYEGKEEGLPFSLEFVVRNKRAQIKCPYCGSKDTARYVYGYPAFTEKMKKNLDNGKWVLGGCCIRSVKMNGKTIRVEPSRCYNECKKDFGTEPILITPKKELAEDYRDIVTAIKFSIGGFFEGHTEITIKKNKNGAEVNVTGFRLNKIDEMIPEQRQITSAKWNKIVNTLYGSMYLHEWKKRFEDPCVMDGTQWSLDIKLTNNRGRHYYGSNAYPPYCPELKKIFRRFAKF